MDSHLVCGVGNIYANESLFRAGLFQNPALLGAVALTVALQLAIACLDLAPGDEAHAAARR